MPKKEKPLIVEYSIMFDKQTGFPTSLESDGTLEDAIRGQEAFLKTHKQALEHQTKAPEKPPHESPSAPLSAVADSFIAVKNRTKRSEEMVLKRRASTELLTRIIGDKPFSEITHEDLVKFEAALALLPPNINKSAKFRDLSIEQILAIPNKETISDRTRAGHILNINSLLDWGYRWRKIDHNLSEVLTPPKKLKGKQNRKRQPLTSDELTLLFSHKFYTEAKTSSFEKWTPFRYWFPIILAFSGLRLSELAQIQLKDLKQVKDIWVFSVDGADSQEGKVGDDKLPRFLKSSNAERLVPVHKRLIELGLLEYQNDLAGAPRLFPDSTYRRNLRRSDQWSAHPSEVIGEIFRTQTIHAKHKVVVHSLRHCFDGQLQSRGVESDHQDQIMGRERTGVGRQAYAADLDLGLKAEKVNMVKYPELDNLSNWTDFKKRAGIKTLLD